MTIIAFTGIPGSGKTTTALELSKLMHAPCLYLSEDVEESAIFEGSAPLFGFKTRLALRKLMFKKFQEAKKLSHQGNLVIVDSYYDKVMHSILEKQGSDFIMKKQNPYFNVVSRLAKYDKFLFPDADIVIGIRIPQKNWNELLRKRNRKLDTDPVFHKNTFLLQEHILSYTKEYCQKRQKQYIEIPLLLNQQEQMVIQILNILNQKQKNCVAKNCLKIFSLFNEEKQNQ